MALQFKKATKKKSRARIAVAGPAGSGKSHFALEVATVLAGGDASKVAAVDTERGSLAKMSGKFPHDSAELSDYGPERYIEAIQAAESAGYEAMVIDSLSHAWAGAGGVLERADQKGGFTGGAWKTLTPLQNKLVDAILTSKMHIVCTLRTKTEYVVEKNDKGKSVPKKVGLAPVQKQDMEYEFDVFAELDIDHNLNIAKSRCDALDGKTFHKQNPEVAKIILDWLNDGEEVAVSPKAPALSVVKTETQETITSAASAAPSGESAASSTSHGEHPIVEQAKAVFGLQDRDRQLRCKDLAFEQLKWAVPHVKNYLKKHYKYNTEGLITALKPEDCAEFEAYLRAELTKANEAAKQ